MALNSPSSGIFSPQVYSREISSCILSGGWRVAPDGVLYVGELEPRVRDLALLHLGAHVLPVVGRELQGERTSLGWN